MDLSEAQVAYEMALGNLEQELPKPDSEPVEIDPEQIAWGQVLVKVILLFPLAMWRGFKRFFGAIWREIDEQLHHIKNGLVRFIQQKPVIMGGPEIKRRARIRTLLLELLWARDHVQESLEREDGATYQSKRATLSFVMQNENRLQKVGQRALAVADLSPSELREAQPSAPDPSHWWWYLNYPRAKRARRTNTFWLIMALIPALASVVLITLLAQRLAINGPDLLSGASVVAQVGLGLGSILAGRELLDELLRQGVSGGWEGRVAFMLATLFFIVIVMFYFLAPPAAAVVYNAFGQRAINSGNAAEAELYLESAARLDPDPYAASMLEVGCLYQTLGSPDNARTVFERVLEADSRLLLARYHLAELYSDEGEYDKALKLLEDGLNLLTVAAADEVAGKTDFLPRIDTVPEFDQMEYLLRLARGRSYLENDATMQAEANLAEAGVLFDEIEASLPEGYDGDGTNDPLDLSCGPNDDLRPFVLSTEMNLHYYLALTYDTLCDSEATIELAQREWQKVRNEQSRNSRQDTWRDEAARRLNAVRDGHSCLDNYGLDQPPPDLGQPAPQPVQNP